MRALKRGTLSVGVDDIAVTTQAHEGIETTFENIIWKESEVTTQAHEGIETGRKSGDSKRGNR